MSVLLIPRLTVNALAQNKPRTGQTLPGMILGVLGVKGQSATGQDQDDNV